MGKKHFLLTFICIFVVLLINPAGLRGQTSDNREGQKYDIAAYVWPSYHPDDRAKIFWPDGNRKILSPSFLL